MVDTPADVLTPDSTSTYYAASSASGIVQGLGTYYASGFSGPFLEETQTLNIDYVRVPMGGSVSSTSPALNSYGVGIRIAGTGLQIVTTASYSRRKVYNWYDVSSFQQPQKFQWNAMSADSYGNTYGTLTASTLGPQGTVMTTQPYYNRRPWNDATDTEVSKTMDRSTNVVVIFSGCNTPIALPEQSQYIGNFNLSILTPNQAGYLGGSQWGPGGIYGAATLDVRYAYRLWGKYNSNQETLQQILMFIDMVGSTVSAVQLWSMPPKNPATTLPWGSWTVNPDAGFSEYDISRHDYT